MQTQLQLKIAKLATGLGLAAMASLAMAQAARPSAHSGHSPKRPAHQA